MYLFNVPSLYMNVHLYHMFTLSYLFYSHHSIHTASSSRSALTNKTRGNKKFNGTRTFFGGPPSFHIVLALHNPQSARQGGALFFCFSVFFVLFILFLSVSSFIFWLLTLQGICNFLIVLYIIIYPRTQVSCFSWTGGTWYKVLLLVSSTFVLLFPLRFTILINVIILIGFFIVKIFNIAIFFGCSSIHR